MMQAARNLPHALGSAPHALLKLPEERTKFKASVRIGCVVAGAVVSLPDLWLRRLLQELPRYVRFHPGMRSSRERANDNACKVCCGQVDAQGAGCATRASERVLQAMCSAQRNQFNQLSHAGRCA